MRINFSSCNRDSEEASNIRPALIAGPGLDGWRVEYTLLLFRMLRFQLWPLGWPAFSALSTAPSLIRPFCVFGALLGYMYWWFVVLKAKKVTLPAKGDIVNIHHELLLLSCQLPFSLFSFNNHSQTDANPDILERKRKVGRFYSKRQTDSWVVQILSLWRESSILNWKWYFATHSTNLWSSKWANWITETLNGRHCLRSAAIWYSNRGLKDDLLFSRHSACIDRPCWNLFIHIDIVLFLVCDTED